MRQLPHLPAARLLVAIMCGVFGSRAGSSFCVSFQAFWSLAAEKAFSLGGIGNGFVLESTTNGTSGSRVAAT
jgi:hypothetical protein